MPPVLAAVEAGASTCEVCRTFTDAIGYTARALRDGPHRPREARQRRARRVVTVVARWLREGGHEVIYLGLYNTPERVAQIALQEDADLVGVICLSTDRVYASPRVRATLEATGLAQVSVVVGGVLTPEMKAELGRLGVAGVFGAGTRREPLLESLSAATGRPGDHWHASPAGSSAQVRRVRETDGPVSGKTSRPGPHLGRRP